MSTRSSGTSAENKSATAVDRRERARVAAAVLIGVVVAAFALLNLDQVKVHWVVATARTPLIVVILLAFLLGAVADRIVIVRARRRKRRG
jgi:uncharacterized integral membrane protein